MRGDRLLVRGRRLAESLMPTVGVVRRATGEFTEDPVTLEQMPVYADILTGRCKIKGATGMPNGAEVPGMIVVTQNAEIQFPIAGSGVVQTDDVWECTESRTDPDMVGKKVRISGEQLQTFATARRFPIEATS